MSVRLGVSLPGPFSVSVGHRRGGGNAFGDLLISLVAGVLYLLIWIVQASLRLATTLGIWALDVGIAAYDNRQARRNVH